MNTCPCCSGKIYTDCCETVINKESAITALELMRSRYTASQTQQAEYLYKTTHPKTRVKSSLSEIEIWTKENTWTKLEIVNIEKGTQTDTAGIVEFKAHFVDKYGSRQIHHEKSSFLKEGEKWFYLSPFVTGHWSFVICHWLSAIGNWLLNIEYWIFSLLTSSVLVPTGRKALHADKSKKHFPTSVFVLPTSDFQPILTP